MAMATIEISLASGNPPVSLSSVMVTCLFMFALEPVFIWLVLI
jgi:hypothetical protein